QVPDHWSMFELNCSKYVPKESLHSSKARRLVHVECRGKKIGTDFRYAVEFSRNGRAPFSTSRPIWGQPDLRYPILPSASTAGFGIPVTFGEILPQRQK